MPGAITPSANHCPRLRRSKTELLRSRESRNKTMSTFKSFDTMSGNITSNTTTSFQPTRTCLAARVSTRAKSELLVAAASDLQQPAGAFIVAKNDLIAPRARFFLYLNDVEAGGHTKFNSLGIEVKPKKGRAVLWPSVLSGDPESTNGASDGRTMHEAMPVTAGVKYGANVWIHQYDFRAPNLLGCTG